MKRLIPATVAMPSSFASWSSPPLRSSRYRLVKCIATGGMGAVHAGFLRGAAGFERPVAIKRAHPHVLADADAREMILREARHASLVRHPSVVSVDDVEEVDGELLLVMDYVEGTSLSHLLASEMRMPSGVALRIALDACAGLEAIHSARDANGQPLALVHRDVSPQNVLVGIDGLARITDYGIAKTADDPHWPRASMRRGKSGYMAPEYILSGISSASCDMFAFGVVVWEMLAGRRLFKGDADGATLDLTLETSAPRLSSLGLGATLGPLLDAVVAKALASAKAERFASMHALRVALEQAAEGRVASRDEVGAYVTSVAGSFIEELRRELRSSGSRVEATKADAHPSPRTSVSAAHDNDELLVSSLFAVSEVDAMGSFDASLDSPARVLGSPEAPVRAFLRLTGIGVVTALIVFGTAALAHAGLIDEPSTAAPIGSTATR
jgi:serine/threonine-protein kinase